MPFLSPKFPIVIPKYVLWILRNRNNDVKICAYFLFLATRSIPDVSLSILWTANGVEFLNSLLLLIISIIFFFDLVPDWTAMPDGLLITTKFSLSSKKILEV